MSSNHARMFTSLNTNAQPADSQTDTLPPSCRLPLNQEHYPSSVAAIIAKAAETEQAAGVGSRKWRAQQQWQARCGRRRQSERMRGKARQMQRQEVTEQQGSGKGQPAAGQWQAAGGSGGRRQQARCGTAGGGSSKIRAYGAQARTNDAAQRSAAQPFTINIETTPT
jgi:hypothetical protein